MPIPHLWIGLALTNMLVRTKSGGVLWTTLAAVFGVNLTSALTSTTMGNSLSDSSVPLCPLGVNNSTHHLRLGQACLAVTNADPSDSLQLWAQSLECHLCRPWQYLSLDPGDSHSLAVNSTYPTILYIRDNEQLDLYQMRYHFGDYGKYSLNISTSNSPDIKTVRWPNKDYLPLILAVLFYVFLAFIWQCTKFLGRRMDMASRSPPAQRVTDEYSPLLSSPQPRSQIYSPPQEPQPSTSTATASPQQLPPTDIDIPDGPPVPAPHHGPLPDTRREGGRLISLDAFRGLAIVLMIFVNYGGGKYYFFAHARWNGLSVADLVFPWFMWIMGTSLVFSVKSQLRRATRRHSIAFRICKRCIYLFAFGLIINSVGGKNYMPDFRILGVLQRFAISYFLTALVEVYCTNPQESPEYVWYWRFRDLVRSGFQWTYTISLVIIHIFVTFLLYVPECGRGYIGPGGLHQGGTYSNCTGGAAGYIDRVVFGSSHVYSHPTCAIIYNSNTPYDPEGLLGSLTSVLMVQFGAACGRIIVTFPSHRGRIIRWAIWATITGMLAGFLCDWRKEGGPIPVNKNLWSLSYVLCTACFAFILFTFMYFIIDQKKWWSGNPLRYAGMNSILLYVGHEICGGLFPFSWKPVGKFHSDYLIMNLWGMSLWIVIAYICHRKKMYFSV